MTFHKRKSIVKFPIRILICVHIRTDNFVRSKTLYVHLFVDLRDVQSENQRKDHEYQAQHPITVASFESTSRNLRYRISKQSHSISSLQLNCKRLHFILSLKSYNVFLDSIDVSLIYLSLNTIIFLMLKSHPNVHSTQTTRKRKFQRILSLSLSLSIFFSITSNLKISSVSFFHFLDFWKVSSSSSKTQKTQKWTSI